MTQTGYLVMLINYITFVIRLNYITMSEDQIKLILSILTDVRTHTSQIGAQLKIVDKRLSLIEQRLTNIEPWITVDNSHLQYAEGTQVNA